MSEFDLAVLRAISHETQPASWYQLERVMYQYWPGTLTSVVPPLERLERDGLIVRAPHEIPNPRFVLSETGRQLLQMKSQ